MNVFLDDVAVVLPDATLPVALDVIGAHAGERGRIVVEVLCDGVPASEEQLAGSGAGISELRCRSADPRELVRATLEDAVRELDLLIPDQKATRDKLWVGRTPEAMDELRGILERWRMVREALEQCARAMDVPLERITSASGATGAGVAAAMARDLEAIRAELAAGHVVELADLIGGNLCELASSWRGVIAAFGESLANPEAGRTTLAAGGGA